MRKEPLAAGQREISTGRLCMMVCALGLAYFFSNFHRLSLGVIGADVGVEFGLTASQLGFLGSVFFYTYALMQICAGILSDRVEKRILIALSCLASAIGTLLFARAQRISGLAVSRALTGLAVAFVYVPALAALRSRFQDKKLGTMNGILVAMGQVGSLCASVPLRASAAALGWRGTMLLVAAVSFVLCGVTYFAIPQDIPKTPQTRTAVGAWKAAFQPGALSIALWFFINGGCRLSFQSLWGSRYYTDVLGQSPMVASTLLMCISVGCIFGAVLIGRLSDRFGSIRTVIYSTLVSVLLWTGLTLCCRVDAPFPIVAALSALIGLVGTGSFTVGFVCIREFAGKSATGIVTGINNCCTFLGSALFTQFTGSVVELGETAAAGFRLLFALFAGLTLLSTVPVYLLNRGILKKQEGIAIK